MVVFVPFVEVGEFVVEFLEHGLEEGGDEDCAACSGRENEVVTSGPAAHVLGLAGIVAKLIVGVVATVRVCLALENVFVNCRVGED